MNYKELAELYMDLSMKYEEEFPVECGFEAATKARTNMVEKIQTGSLSKKDMNIIKPIFSYGNLDVTQYLKAKKRFIFF